MIGNEQSADVHAVGLCGSDGNGKVEVICHSVTHEISAGDHARFDTRIAEHTEEQVFRSASVPVCRSPPGPDKVARLIRSYLP